MNRPPRVVRAIRTLTIAGLTLLPAPAIAAPLILNGGFEAGLTSWLTADQPGSDGTFFLQTGTSSPLNGIPVPAPPGGVRAAMTDQQGPGSHLLYQDFVVPVGVTSATLSFDLFVNNLADAFFLPSPPTLDFTTPAANQQARVDLLMGSSGLFSVAPGDVLQNLYQTDPGDPLTAGYFTTTIDLTALLASRAGQTLRLRFAEVDNVLNFNLGVDNVSLDAVSPVVVPEPVSLLLLVGGLAAGALRRRRA
jgi:hypothetical protein